MTSIEYGILDVDGSLLLIPDEHSYLKPTTKDLVRLLALFGDQAKVVKVTIEDYAPTALPADTLQIQ